MNSPIRREILWRIWSGELSAGQIAGAFDLTAPTISEHLAVLRTADLVTMRAAGTFRFYRAKQDSLRGLQSLLAGEESKWLPADDLPERASAHARTELVVVASTDIPRDREFVFANFTDAELYGRWLGVPVRLDRDGNFATTLKWGTTVRGSYALVHPPELIVMQWDFEDARVPIPGGQCDAYARFTDIAQGCHVEVHQLVSSSQQAAFMQSAWTMVLGRLRQGLVPEDRRSAKHRTPRTSA